MRSRHEARQCLHIELLEERLVPTTWYWAPQNNNNLNWSVAANWRDQNGALAAAPPGIDDTVWFANNVQFDSFVDANFNNTVANVILDTQYGGELGLLNHLNVSDKLECRSNLGIGSGIDTGNITVGTLDWWNGPIKGNSDQNYIRVLANLNILGDSEGMKLVQRSVRNSGCVVWSGGLQDLKLEEASFDNEGGSFWVQENKDVSITSTENLVPRFQLKNGGTLSVDAGSSLQISAWFRSDDDASMSLSGDAKLMLTHAFSVGGHVWAEGEESEFRLMVPNQSIEVHQLRNGFLEQGGGTVVIWAAEGESEVEVQAGSSRVDRLRIEQEGTLTGPGRMDVATELDWGSGWMRGAGITRVLPSATAKIHGAVFLDGRTVENDGEMKARGIIEFLGNGRIINRLSGTFVIDEAEVRWNGGPQNEFINNGTFIKDIMQHPLQSVAGVTFVNNAVVDIKSGGWTVSYDYVQNGGRTTLYWAPGSGAWLGTDGIMDIRGGILQGEGQLLASELRNAGIIRPGVKPDTTMAAGVLDLVGSFNQSSGGTIEVWLMSDTEYGILWATGTAQLGGSVRALLNPGYTPAGRRNYDVVRYGSNVGEFGTHTMPNDRFTWRYLSDKFRIIHNNPPDGNDDAFQVRNENLLDVAAADGVLENDVDVDGDTLLVTRLNGVTTAVGTPTMLNSGAWITLRSDGSFTYTPKSGLVYTDGFQYTCSDDVAEVDAAVTIKVLGKLGDYVWWDKNANGIQDSGDEAKAGVAVDIAGPGGFSASTTTSASGQYLFEDLTEGSYTVTVTPPDHFLFSPADQGADDAVDSDAGGGGMSVTLSANTVDLDVGLVNRPPALGAISSKTVNEAGTLAFTITASDPEDDDITFSMDTVTGASASIHATTGAFSFSCDDGPATFSVTVHATDVLGQTDTKTFTVTVNNVAPTVSLPFYVSPPNANGEILVSLSGQDPSTADTAAGFLYSYDLNEDGDFGDPGEADSTVNYATFTFTGGTHTVSVRVKDKDGGSNTYAHQVTLNYAPVAQNDSAVTAVDVPVTVAVLANDSDADNDPLTVASVGSASHGMVVINGNNTVTYTPTPAYEGTDGFTYTVSDGQGGTASASVSITIGQPQLLDGGADGTRSVPATLLTEELLRPVVEDAFAQLRAAGFRVDGLERAAFQIADLHTSLLGVTYQDTIWIDQDAAGRGWYLGGVSGGVVSGASLGEFGRGVAGREFQAFPGSGASERVDLLTVVMHELGHVLGFDSISPAIRDHDWMTATLTTGTRRLPDLAPPSASLPVAPLPQAIVSQAPSQGLLLPQLAKEVPTDSSFAFALPSLKMGPLESDWSALLWVLSEDDLGPGLEEPGKSPVSLLEQKPDSEGASLASSEFDLAEPTALGDEVDVLVAGAGSDVVIGEPGENCLAGGFE